MANAKVNIDVGYTIDKNSFNQIMDSLDRVQAKAKSMGSSKDSNLKRQFQEAGDAAKQLQSIMQSSWDSKLNQVNLTKLNTEFKNANMTATKFFNQIGQGGKEGAASANLFARSILDANIQLTQTNKLLDKMAVTFGNTVRYGISSSIFNSFTNAVQRAYDYTKQLDTSLNDIRIVSNQSAEQMEQFAISANKAAQALGRTTLDYTKAATIYFQQGLSSEEVEKRTEVTLKAANVTGQNAQEVSEQLTAVWNGYQVTGEQLEEYVDKLSAVAAHSASNLEELSTGMSKVASAANVMGVDIDQLTAQMSTIISVTRQAPESVGTALRTIYARIADIKAGLDDEVSLGNYTGKMAKLGINVLDASGNLREMGDVIEEIGGKWSTLSKEQQVSLAQIMAGTRQYNNLLTLFDNWDKYEEALETSSNAAGTLQKQQDIYMESTEAHLKQLTAEAEELYATLFDQDAARGFIDILGTGLKSINNYVKALGGGMNAFLGMGAQVANLFSNQIANSINTKIENREIRQAQKDDNKLKEEMAMVHSFEGDNVSAKALDTELEYARKILDVKKNLTQEQAKELVEHQKQIGLLEQQKIQNENALKAAQNTYQLQKLKNKENTDAIADLSKKLGKEEEFFDNFNNVEEEITNRHEHLANLLEKLKTQEVDSTEWVDTNTEIEAEQNYIDTLEQRKEMLQDINSIEKDNVEIIDEQNNRKKAVNDGTKSAGRKGDIQKATRQVTAYLQAATMMVGVVKTFSDETASGADKANAAWQGGVGALSAIANAVAPGTGFIVQGIGALAQGILEATGAWETFEDLFKSSKEKLAEVNKELDEFKKKEREAVNSLTSNKEGIEYLDEIKDRFYYLQELAEKGLLTSSERSEYETYLTKVKEYNEDIVISYDKQGNMIASNTKAIEKTIDKLESANKLLLEQTFTEDLWEEKTKALEKQYKATQGVYKDRKEESEVDIRKQTRDSVETVVDSWDSRTFQSDKKNLNEQIDAHLGNYSLNRDTKAGKELYDQWALVFDIINNQITDEEIEKLKQNPKYLQEAFDAVNEVFGGMDDLWDAYYQEIGKAVNRLESHPEDLDNIYRETIGSLTIDKSVLVNDIKYNSKNNAIYKELEEMGINNIDNIITSYLEGVNVGAEEFQTDGVIDYDKIRNKLLDFEIGLKTILLKSSSESAYNALKEIDVVGKTSQEYETAMIEALKKFLETITDEKQFDKIKDMIPAMFGLDYADVSFDSTKGHAVLGANGNNIVTSGEAKAREASRIIAENNVGALGDKDKAAESIEKYIQNNVDEVDLSNIDTGKLADDFNQLLYQAIDPNTGALVKGKTWNDVLQDAIDKQLSGEDALSKKAYKGVMSLDDLDKVNLDEDELKNYTKHLMEMATKSKELKDSLEDDGESAAVLAKSIMRMNRGIKSLAEGFDEWEDVLTKSSKSSEEYYDALDNVKDAAADLLDVDKSAINSEFITNPERLKELKKAAEGDADAINALRDAYADDILVKIGIENDLNDEVIKSLSDRLNELQAQMNNTNFEMGAIDDAQFIASCQKMIETAGMSVEQAQKMFDAMGIEVKFKTETKETEQKVPKITTKRVITKWDQGQPVEWTESSYQDGFDTFKGETEVFAMATNGKSPVIDTMSSKGNGSMNNYSKVNAGGGSAKKGSSAKPSKKDLNKEQLDRYQLVNVQLKEISKQLSKLDKQKNKLLGGQLVDNLNKQIKLLNDQISVTEAKLKIAQGEQNEVAQKLSGYGITFDKDGNIANYAQIFNQEQAKLNAIYTNYNNMSKEAQDNYADTVKAAEESWKTFKESITKYDSLIGDTIPSLEQDIADAFDKQTEMFIEEFNAEIKVRLDMSSAEREWNAFKTKVIDGIKDDDILGLAKSKLKDFNTYYNEEQTGEVQALTKQIQNQLDELRKQDEEGGQGDWYRDNRVKAMEDLKERYDQIRDSLTALVELEEEMKKKILDSMDQAQDKFDKQIDTFETINKQLEHNIELINLLTDEDNYEQLADQYAAQTQNRKEELDFYTQQKDFWENYLNTLEEGSEEWEAAKEKYNAAAEAWSSALTTTIQAARTEFENNIKIIFKTINNQLTNQKGLDYINEEWELISTNSELALDNINKMQGLQDLSKKYNDAINGTSSIKAQQKLAQLRDSELEALKSMDKLSQQDLERAEKKLDIIKAQIALEDAQANKSKMRMRRDSQGNYRYQFVADEDQVNEAQANLYSAYNELYNFDKARYTETLNQASQAWQEYQEKMAEAALINDPEVRAQKEELIKSQYNERIGTLHEQLERTMQELNESTFAELNALYGENEANYELMTEDQRLALNQFENANQTAFDLVFGLYTENTEAFHNMAQDQIDVIQNQMVPQWVSGYQALVNAITGEGGIEEVSNRMMADIQHAIETYDVSLANTEDIAKNTFDRITSGQNDVIKNNEQLLKDNADLINQYGTMIDNVKALYYGDEESGITGLVQMMNAYKEAADNAKDAAEKAYEYWTKAKDKEAEEYKKNTDAGPTQGGTGQYEHNQQENIVKKETKQYPDVGSWVQLPTGTYFYDAWGNAYKYPSQPGRTVQIKSTSGDLWKVYNSQLDPSTVYIRKSSIGYDTGGYTGEWGNEGRLAMLHQKELVLNKKDTANMLDAVEIMRGITDNIGSDVLSRMASVRAGVLGSAFGGNVLDQNVHIEATFPGVKSSIEIQDALNNLVNMAAQRAQVK